jgi:hypothetical protein
MKPKIVGCTSRWALSSVATLRLVGCCLLPLFAPGNIWASQFVVVLKLGDSSWKVVEAERITCNSKDKLRVNARSLPESGQVNDKLTITQEEYKTLPVQDIKARLVRRHKGGYFVRQNGNAWEFVLPDRAAFKGTATYDSLWSSAGIVYHEGAKSQAGAEIKAEELFAIIPSPSRDEAMAQFLTNESNFRGLGEANATVALDERLSLFVGVAGSVKGAASGQLQQMLLLAMQTANSQMSGGIAKRSDLDIGLKYAEVSKSVYPDDPRQTSAREALYQRDSWLRTRIAILRALDAGELWDDFINKYGEFERFDNSYEDLRKLRETAIRESTTAHLTAGRKLYEAHKYLEAMEELKIAQRSSPGNQDIDTLYKEAQIGAQGTIRHPSADPNSPQQVLLHQYALEADDYIQAAKWDEAKEVLASADAVEKDSPLLMLSRAKLLRDLGELQEALAVVDKYAMIEPLNTKDETLKLKADITVKLKIKKTGNKTEIGQAEANGDFVEALKKAREGIQADPNDFYFLLRAGVDSAILRDYSGGAELVSRSLKAPRMPGKDKEKEQEQAYGFLEIIKRPADGIPNSFSGYRIPNWFSGYKLPAGLLYCPISLMPTARVSSVKASRKQITSYDWSSGALSSIHVSTAQPGETGFDAYFDYFPGRKAVRRVSNQPFGAPDEPALLHFTDKGPIPFTDKGPVPVGARNGLYVVLLNHPTVNPLMVERLTGKRVATIVAGNPYFHPFVWKELDSFLVEYDDEGRINSARQMTSSQGQTLHDFDFKWDEFRLMEIVERGTGDYRRSMTYDGNRILAETISFRGKNSRIDYHYTGDKLVEAKCSDDASIDGRNRQVSFQ